MDKNDAIIASSSESTYTSNNSEVEEKEVERAQRVNMNQVVLFNGVPRASIILDNFTPGWVTSNQNFETESFPI